MTTKEEYHNEENMMAFPAEEMRVEAPEVSSHTESKELNKLFEALSKAQLEMDVARTDSINPYFKSKYADLSSVVKASRPFLAKNGLCVIQRTITNGEGRMYMHTRLCHSSGQWIEANMEVKPPKNDIQSMGSYLTYLRRYMYASLTGVVASDEDDDGEVAMKDPRSGKGPSEETSKISKAQLQVLSNELSSYPEIVENLLKGFSITKISDLPSKHYTKCLERVREIKKAKEN